MIERQPLSAHVSWQVVTAIPCARAMYLGATGHRIHGTNQHFDHRHVCVVRLHRTDVMDLFDRVKVGTRVVVLPAAMPAALASAAPAQPMPNQASNMNAPAPGQPLPPMGAPITVR